MFNIIYLDPPWQFTSKSVSPNREVTNHYPTMNINDIKNLPIEKLAHKNCYLFLWINSPNLDIGIEVLKHWGFQYKTIAFCWVKQNKKQPTFFMGLGSYTRSNVELCLLGVKGNLKRLNANVRQLIVSPLREHSRKPDETRDRIVKLYGDIPKIELFARQTTDGWTCIGNEITNNDIITDINNLIDNKNK